MVTFDKYGFATNDGLVTVYVTDSQGLYSHSVDEFVSVGTGVSANSYLDAPPPTKEGFVIKRVDGSWRYVADHRGQTIYSITDKHEQGVDSLGDIPEGYTLLKPQTPLDDWDGDKWVTSEEVKARVKSELLEQNRNRLIDDIDNCAAKITAHWTRFSEEYKERESAALAYQQNNFEGEPNIYITSFSSVAGLDNKAATLLILKQAAGLRHLQEQLAIQRMRKYELKKTNLTLAQMEEIHNDIIKQMHLLATEVK